MRVWDNAERMWKCSAVEYWDRHFAPLTGSHPSATAEMATLIIVRRDWLFPDYKEEENNENL